MKFFALIGMAAAIKLEGDNGLIDLVNSKPKECEKRLWISKDEMDYQMDQFSRHFDIKNLNNALEIQGKIGQKANKVHAWELNDKAFSFPRIRRYDEVNTNMDQLEHFQDNLNTNISNTVNQQKFIAAAKKSVAALNDKYHNGGYDDPANHSTRKE